LFYGYGGTRNNIGGKSDSGAIKGGLGELQAGVALTREQDEAKAQALQDWVDLVTASYKVLSTDGAAFRMWATLIHRKSDTLNEDAMIAAIARIHRLTVVTRYVADFSTFGVSVLNPFKSV